MLKQFIFNPLQAHKVVGWDIKSLNKNIEFLKRQEEDLLADLHLAINEVSILEKKLAELDSKRTSLNVSILKALLKKILWRMVLNIPFIKSLEFVLTYKG